MWKIENQFENPIIEAKVDIKDCCATVTLKDSSYSLARIVTTLGAVR